MDKYKLTIKIVKHLNRLFAIAILGFLGYTALTIDKANAVLPETVKSAFIGGSMVGIYKIVMGIKDETFDIYKDKKDKKDVTEVTKNT